MCQLFRNTLSSPIGVLDVCCCEKGVHSVHISDEKLIDHREPFSHGNTFHEIKMPLMTDVNVWLQDYFDSSNNFQRKPPPICPLILSSKGKFTENVWKTLLASVPAGKTVSYGHLAKLCGSVGASRAVGTAMKNNPVPLLIPCHRVIKSDGSIGHYSGGSGMNVKEWLLLHEALK